MFSRTARYALHILGHLAAHPDRMSRGEEIAAATDIPANYLAKILNQLRKAGLVESRKGWGGGFRLREGAGRRPIREVLELFDGVGSTDRRDCAFGRERCDDRHPCAMHEHWAQVRESYETMITTTRVADLAGR